VPISLSPSMLGPLYRVELSTAGRGAACVVFTSSRERAAVLRAALAEMSPDANTAECVHHCVYTKMFALAEECEELPQVARVFEELLMLGEGAIDGRCKLHRLFCGLVENMSGFTSCDGAHCVSASLYNHKDRKSADSLFERIVQSINGGDTPSTGARSRQTSTWTSYTRGQSTSYGNTLDEDPSAKVSFHRMCARARVSGACLLLPTTRYVRSRTEPARGHSSARAHCRTAAARSKSPRPTALAQGA